MAYSHYGVSNCHVADDVTWPAKVLWGNTVGYPSDSLASCMFCWHKLWAWYYVHVYIRAFPKAHTVPSPGPVRVWRQRLPTRRRQRATSVTSPGLVLRSSLVSDERRRSWVSPCRAAAPPVSPASRWLSTWKHHTPHNTICRHQQFELSISTVVNKC